MELFKILGTVAINGVGQAESQLNGLVKKAQGGADKMKTGFANIGKAAKAVAVTAGAAFTAIGGAIVGVVASTEEYRLAMAKVSTAFETVGMSADQGKKMFNDFYGVLGDTGQATEAINHLAKLTTDQQSLSEWTTICTGIYATFGESLPIEGLTEAANETARTGALTGGLADALNWAGVNEDEFQAKLDACTTTQEREALIRETLNGLYTEAGTKYRENAADLIAANEAQARMTDALAVFGEKAQPILTAVKNGFAGIVERAAAFLSEVDMNGITNAINGAFSWFIDTAIPAIQTGVQWVISNKDVILAIITGIGAGFVAWNVVQIVQGAIQAFTAFKATLDLVKTGQLALNLAMNANPIGIIITLVAALVAAFIYLWNNCEGFRNFFIGMWEKIKSALQPIIDGLVAYFKIAWENIKAVWDVVVAYFTMIWENIKLVFAVVQDVLSGNFSGAWDKIKQIFANVGQYFQAVWDGIKRIFGNVDGFFGGIFTKAWDGIKNAWSAVVNFFANIRERINGAFSSVDKWMGDKFGGAWTAIKNIYAPFVDYFKQKWESVKGIFAAVKAVLSGDFAGAWDAIKGIFAGWGNYFTGLWNKVTSVFSSVGSWFSSIFTSAWASIKNAWSGVTGWFSNIWETIKGFFTGTVPIPKIKLPKFAITPSGWKIGDLLDGVIPKLGITWNARGGVFDKPTIMQGVGEDGAEAVVPLEKNLGWLDKLSGMLCERIVPGGNAGATNYNSALETMQNTLVSLLDKLDNMQLVLDTGAVVGGIAPAMDAELGNIRIRKGRAQ